MYQKKSKGWYEHKVFNLIDLLCISMTFILVDWIRNVAIRNLYENEIYRNAVFFLLLLSLGVRTAKQNITIELNISSHQLSINDIFNIELLIEKYGLFKQKLRT